MLISLIWILTGKWGLGVLLLLLIRKTGIVVCSAYMITDLRGMFTSSRRHYDKASLSIIALFYCVLLNYVRWLSSWLCLQYGKLGIVWSTCCGICFFWVCVKSTSFEILMNCHHGFGLFREDRRLVISEETDAKAERVRRELERIRLKASLLEIIKSTGEVCREFHLNVSSPLFLSYE